MQILAIQPSRLLSVLLLAQVLLVGCSEESTEPEAVSTLDAPTELQASRIPGQRAVRLTWRDNSNSEVGFAIERQEGAGPFHYRIFTIQNMTTAIDSMDMTIGSTYSYRVRAIRYVDFSASSNVTSVTLSP